MTVQESITHLRRFNIWRRYDGPAGCAPKMPDPKVIGEAIDVLCDYAEHRLSIPTYFRLEELLRSKTALDKKIENYPSWEDVENLRDLAFDLDLIREDVNAPINVTSGFRGEELNKTVGGAETSVHKIGSAADMQCPTLKFEDFKKRVVGSVQRRGTKFDQLIIEEDSRTKAKWLHYGQKNNAGQQRLQIKFLVKK